jgi:serine/threonine-protein kinase RsbW
MIQSGTGNSSWTGALDKPLRFIIPSVFVEGHHVQKRILDEVAKNHYSEDATFAIRLSLDEALINAIKHGNKLDPNKKVIVEAKITPDHAEIVVEDEGPGFDRSSVPDPTCEENLERLHGRGILLMEAYMTEVEFTRGGRRVRLVRKNDAPVAGRRTRS